MLLLHMPNWLNIFKAESMRVNDISLFVNRRLSDADKFTVSKFYFR